MTIDDVSGPATGLLRIGDDLLTINGGVNGVTVLTAGLAVAGVARATTQVRTPTLIGVPEPAGRHYRHQSARRLQQRDAQNRGRRDPVPHQGAQRQQLGRRLHDRAGDQEHGRHGDGQAGRQHGNGLRAAGALNAPGQEIWLQNRLTNGIVTTAYGQNDLSDKKVKQNVRDADLEELQAIFDRAAPKRYDRADGAAC